MGCVIELLLEEFVVHAEFLERFAVDFSLNIGVAFGCLLVQDGGAGVDEVVFGDVGEGLKGCGCGGEGEILTGSYG